MTDTQLIEQVVQEVVRRLREMSTPETTLHGNNVGSCQSLKIDERVIALAALEGRLDGVKQLIVQPKAIVTPAVRDELRDRDIKLVRSVA